MEQKQLIVRIDKKLHTKYFIHALKTMDNLSDWVKVALQNQYKLDKEKKK